MEIEQHRWFVSQPKGRYSRAMGLLFPGARIWLTKSRKLAWAIPMAHRSLEMVEEGAWAVDPAELPTRRGPGQLPAAVEQEEGA